MRWARLRSLAVFAGTLGMAWLGAGCDAPLPAASRPPQLSVADVMGTDPDDGFRRAENPVPFLFPADHGGHPEFHSEWWYIAGNVADAAGRPFSYQVTFFRVGLRAEGRVGSSAWAADDVWMAHLAVGDPTAGRFHAFERFSRGALGLAGVQADPFRVWLEDWSAAWTPAGDEATGHIGGSASADIRTGLLPLRLRAAGNEVVLDLVMSSAKPGVLQGERGFSRKGDLPGSASHYYSLTRLSTGGTLSLGGEPFEVSGDSWMDREWSSSALEPGQVGWDWFALQLSDGRELMVYLLRRADGSIDPNSSGTLVAADGRSTHLVRESFDVRVDSTWQSPRGGTPYPSRWTVRVPGAEIELVVEPVMPDQELDLVFRYWEGAVEARGTAGGAPVTARGFVELTGYADPPAESPPGGG